MKLLKSSLTSFTSHRYSERTKPLASYHNQPIPPACKLDASLYITLLSYRSHSASKAQTAFVKFLRSYIKSSLPGARCRTDAAGNLYVTKGKPSPFYPALVAHCDINQQTCTHAATVIAHGWMTGIDTRSGERVGPGHDDKAGCLLALQMLRALPACKVLFTVDEEVGGIGAGQADIAFFADCCFVIQADRNAYAGPEFISYSGGVELASADYMTAIAPAMQRYRFKEADGVFTDVNVLKEAGLDVCCANITAGYFNEHSANEALYIPAWENSAAFTLELFTSALIKERWTHRAEPRNTRWYEDLETPYSWLDDAPETTYNRLDDAKNCCECGTLLFSEAQEVDGYTLCPSCFEWNRI